MVKPQKPHTDKSHRSHRSHKSKVGKQKKTGKKKALPKDMYTQQNVAATQKHWMFINANVDVTNTTLLPLLPGNWTVSQ